MNIFSIKEIIDDFRNGKMVIMIDDKKRENEGDLFLASDFVTHDAINFMIKYARGLVCLTLTSKHCKRLHLPMMSIFNNSKFKTNFTVSIEASTGVTTGISVPDRVRTIKVASNKNAIFTDIVQPGHIFPLKAVKGGVLKRAGHTEAGCDLAKIAGLTPFSVICEIINDNGYMARLSDLLKFSSFFNIKIGIIRDLIKYIKNNKYK